MVVLIVSIALIVGGLILGAMGIFVAPSPHMEKVGQGIYEFHGEETGLGERPRITRRAQLLTSLGLVLTSAGSILSLIPAILASATP